MITNEEIRNLTSILNEINEVIYIADPDTFELVYGNRVFEENWGAGNFGKKCYKVLQDRDTPCPFCTNDKILGKNLGKKYIWEFRNQINKRWYKCVDSSMRWADGRDLRFEIAYDITDYKHLESDLEKQTVKLTERNKEIQCIYEILLLTSDLESDSVEIMEKIPGIIKKSWQYPEVTCVNLKYLDHEFKTGKYEFAEWRQTAEIILANRRLGFVEVCYTAEMPNQDEGPFLAEERELINSIANEIAKYYQKKQTLETLHKHSLHLEETVNRQTNEIIELSTPVLPLFKDILVAPLIGQFNNRRAEMLTEKLLDSISEVNAQIVILDITGVPTVDTQTAQQIMETITAAKLLGTMIILTGIRPEIARTMVHLGIKLEGITTESTLSAGVKSAMKYLETNSLLHNSGR